MMKQIRNLVLHSIILFSLNSCFFTEIDSSQVWHLDAIKSQRGKISNDQFCSELLNAFSILLPERNYLYGSCLEQGWTPYTFPPSSKVGLGYVGTSYVDAYERAATCGDQKAIQALQRLGKAIPKQKSITEGYHIFWKLMTSNSVMECGYKEDPTIFGWATAMPIYLTILFVAAATSPIWVYPVDAIF